MSEDCFACFLVNFIHREINNEAEFKSIFVNQVELFWFGKPCSYHAGFFFCVVFLVVANEEQRLAFFDTRQLREVLGGVPLNEPDVIAWMKESIEEEFKPILEVS